MYSELPQTLSFKNFNKIDTRSLLSITKHFFSEIDHIGYVFLHVYCQIYRNYRIYGILNFYQLEATRSNLRYILLEEYVEKYFKRSSSNLFLRNILFKKTGC